MAALDRKFLKQFAEQGAAQFFHKFGGFQSGDNSETKDVEELQSLSAFTQGWQNACENGMKLPALEEMNALFYVFGYFLKYLMQTGIPEWNAQEEYKAGAVVKYNKTIYTAQVDNLNVVPGSNGNWDAPFSVNYNLQARMLSIKDNTDTTGLQLDYSIVGLIRNSSLINARWLDVINTANANKPAPNTLLKEGDIGIAYQTGVFLEVKTGDLLYIGSYPLVNGQRYSWVQADSDLPANAICLGAVDNMSDSTTTVLFRCTANIVQQT